MNDDRIDRLHAAGGLSDLDREFARLMERLSGSNDELLPLAAALVSRASNEGNICLPLDSLAGTLISAGESAVRCPDLKQWVSALRESPVVGSPGEWRPLVLSGSRLYLYRHWADERSLADFLRERSEGGIYGRNVDIPLFREGLARLFDGDDEESTDWQKVAATLAVLKPFCVITGGPGTGKTTTAAKILALLMEQAKSLSPRIALAAPTGKAAARLQEAIRESAGRLCCGDGIRSKLAVMEAATLHRLLGHRSGYASFVRYEEELLPYDVVIVDEASMVSLNLLCSLTRALPRDAKLILLGDRDQLASVEAGAVLGELCGPERRRRYSRSFGAMITAASGQSLPLLSEGDGQSPIGDCIAELRRNYRFGAESGIGVLSRAINEGGPEEVFSILRKGEHSDLGWKSVPNPRDLSRTLKALVIAGYGDYLEAGTPSAIFERFNRFRILCALRDGPYSVNTLNVAVEGILASEGILQPGRLWYEGRPVMVTRNDYGLRLFNGDIGIALADPDHDNALRVFFPAADGTMRAFNPYRLPEHETVFAMTIHKSQGSEFDRVLLVLPGGDARVLTRELLYTGLTRARMRIDVWAGEAALKAALSRRIERVSGLRDVLWAEGTGNR